MGNIIGQLAYCFMQCCCLGRQEQRRNNINSDAPETRLLPKRSHQRSSATGLRRTTRVNPSDFGFRTRLDSINHEPWYFGNISRLKSNQLLLKEGNQNGSFLIRQPETGTHKYTLSLRYSRDVIHYRVEETFSSNGERSSVFITPGPGATFGTLQELIEYHYGNLGGLVTTLTVPCIKVRKCSKRLKTSLSHNTSDGWEIPRSSLTFRGVLRQGSFGKVHEGLLNGLIVVAIKSLKPGTMDPQDFLAEAQLMKKLRHPRLIRLYAVCTTEEPIYIVTELMENGSLLGYLKGKGNNLKRSVLIKIAIQVASGMAYLESENYIHRDLAARNVLVGENNKVKVADFGLARVIKEDEYKARAGGPFPFKWTAPEAINQNKFSIKSDVWSFGILLTEIVTYGGTPYPGMSNNDLLRNLDNDYRMPRPENCPSRLYEIMLQTWNNDPPKRPTFVALQSMLENFLLERRRRK